MTINQTGARDEAASADATLVDIRHLSADQLQQLGVTQLAYVKPVVMNGARVYAIHAADGTPMAVAGDREVAVAAIRQHDMVPTLVH